MAEKGGIKIVADNRRARHDYEILDKYEAGMVLQGSEIKSIRAGRVQLKDGYVDLVGDEAWLASVHIAEYPNAGYAQHAPERRRKILMHRAELDRLGRAVREKGLTLIALKMYLKGGRAKVEVGLVRGKKRFDKRQSLKEKAANREMDRAMKKARQ